jgi:hypothetical protein
VVAFAATVVAVTALAVAVAVAVAVVAVIAVAVAVAVGVAVACDKGIPSLMLSPCCWQQRRKAGTTGDKLILQSSYF